MARPPDPGKRKPGSRAAAGLPEGPWIYDDINLISDPLPPRKPQTLAGRRLALAHGVHPALADLVAELVGLGRAA